MQPNKWTGYEMISDFPQKRKNYWQIDRMDKARSAHTPSSAPLSPSLSLSLSLSLPTLAPSLYLFPSFCLALVAVLHS